MLPVPICNNEEGCLFLFLTLPLNIKMPFAVVTDRNTEERRSSRKSIASPAAVHQSLLSISEKTGNYLQTSFKPAGVSGRYNLSGAFLK